MKIHSISHAQRGVLVAICGFDGSGKSTLEASLLAAIGSTRQCVVTYAPTQWWRHDANTRQTLYGEGAGQMLPEESLLHFNLADCYAHQAHSILPALGRGKLVISNRYLYDMLSLFEARGLQLPRWLPDAVAEIVKPDVCFVLDGPAKMLVDRVVRRDGPQLGRFDQDVPFVGRYNTALRRMASANDLIVLRAEDDPRNLLQQCLDVLQRAGWL